MASQFKNLSRSPGTELAAGIEYSQQRNSECTLTFLASAFQPFEDGVEVLFAPQAHAYGNVDFGVKNVFMLELLHQAVGDELVVFRRLQVFGDGLECH